MNQVESTTANVCMHGYNINIKEEEEEEEEDDQLGQVLVGSGRSSLSNAS